MQQLNITLQGPEEDGQTIKLIVGDQQHQTHHLNLQQARSLATELIQLTHQTGVRNIMDWSGAISDKEFAIMLRELFSEPYGG